MNPSSPDQFRQSVGSRTGRQGTVASTVRLLVSQRLAAAPMFCRSMLVSRHCRWGAVEEEAQAMVGVMVERVASVARSRRHLVRRNRARSPTSRRRNR